MHIIIIIIIWLALRQLLHIVGGIPKNKLVVFRQRRRESSNSRVTSARWFCRDTFTTEFVVGRALTTY